MASYRGEWVFYCRCETRWIADAYAYLMVASGECKIARVRTSVTKGNPFPFAVYIVK